MTEILKVAETKQKFRAGRKNKLSLENRLLMTLEYWKEYSTYRIIAKRYGIQDLQKIHKNTFYRLRKVNITV